MFERTNPMQPEAAAAKQMDAEGKIMTDDIFVAVAALRSGRCTRLDTNGYRSAEWGDAEAGRLADALTTAGGGGGGGARLECLLLHGGEITDKGADRIAAAIESGACPALEQVVFLGGVADIGHLVNLQVSADVGKKALARIAAACWSAGDLPELRTTSTLEGLREAGEAGLLTAEDVQTMAENPVILAMANPIPEILPDEARRGGAAVIGTGRSDFPNQVNNVLAFPGIFRGALDASAPIINGEMKIAAAAALAADVEEASAEMILPHPLDRTVAPNIAKKVRAAAKISI